LGLLGVQPHRGAELLMTKRTGPAGIALVKRFEKLELTAYRCPAGRWTCGYGHIGPDVHEGMTITEERAEELLRMDLAEAEEPVNRLCPGLGQNQFDAVVSFVFNLGAGNFSSSTLLRKLREDDVMAAALEFPKWRFATGKPLTGLLRRRFAEAELFLT
jgi:lysozyme